MPPGDSESDNLPESTEWDSDKIDSMLTPETPRQATERRRDEHEESTRGQSVSY